MLGAARACGDRRRRPSPASTASPRAEGDDAAVLRAAGAQQPGQPARVDAGDRRPCPRAAGSRRARRSLRKFDARARHVLDDQPGGEDLRRLDVFRVDAVVADVRIRQRDDLPAVARIGEDFLVAGQRGVEHHLADRLAGGADRMPWNTVPSASARRAWAWSGSSCGDKGQLRIEARRRCGVWLSEARRPGPSSRPLRPTRAERAEAANCSRGRGAPRPPAHRRP